jgi:hypothetical protein
MLWSVVKPLFSLVSSPKKNSTSTQCSEPFCLTIGSYTGVWKGGSNVHKPRLLKRKRAPMRKPHKRQVESSRRGWQGSKKQQRALNASFPHHCTCR